jgi:hypothetical protein
MKINYYDKPAESLESLLEKFNPNMYLIMDDVLSSTKSYRYIYQQLLDILKWGFEVAEIRKRPISFKFHADDAKIHTLQLTNFLSNLILWYAFMDMDMQDILDETYIFDFSKFTMMRVVDYINDRILSLHEGDFYSKNKIVDEIFYNITAISNAFCLLMGMSISIYDIIQVEKSSPEVSEIIFGKIDPSLQPSEIESELDRRTTRLIELFSQVDCDLKPLLVSGKNISKGQFKEMFVKIGLKADINGNTIPMLIDANLVVTGLNKPSYLYIEAGSARKSLIMTKQDMGEPGAFSKKINLLATSATILRKDYETCNSSAFVEYNIKDDLFLRLLDNRNYYDERGVLRRLNYQHDKHLIGKIVPFTSPTTCSSHEGVCKKCYGGLFDINQDLFSAGSFAATKSSNPFGQTVLKSKHYQGTESNTIEFNEDYDKVFDLTSTEVSIKDSIDDDEDLYILLDDVKTDESDDDESYYVKSFKIVDERGKVLYNIAEENELNLYLSEQLLSAYKHCKDKVKMIPLDTFDSEDDSVLFVVEIKNKELTEPLKLIEKILNRKDKMGAQTLSDVCQLLAESFISIGILVDLVHIEAIVRGLVRKRSNHLEFPDWSRNGDHNDYIVTQVNSGLFNNPSALISLSYGYVRKQLISPEFYEKTAPSHLDALFARQLSKYID